MNHKAIVAKQLNEELVSLRARLAVVEAGILALGGTVTHADAVPKRSRNRKAVAGASTTTSTASRAPRVRARANGADSPELIAALKAISERTDIHGIQKAQESRKVRAAFKRGDSVAAPSHRPEGAVLGEAAAAEA